MGDLAVDRESSQSHWPGLWGCCVEVTAAGEGGVGGGGGGGRGWGGVQGGGGAAPLPPPCTGTGGGAGGPGAGVHSEELPGSPSSGPGWAEGRRGQQEAAVVPGEEAGQRKEAGWDVPAESGFSSGRWLSSFWPRSSSPSRSVGASASTTWSHRDGRSRGGWSWCPATSVHTGYHHLTANSKRHVPVHAVSETPVSLIGSMRTTTRISHLCGPETMCSCLLMSTTGGW